MGFGFQAFAGALAGLPGPSAQSGAPAVISITLRPRAVASRTTGSIVEKSYDVLPGLVGSEGRVGAIWNHAAFTRTIPAPVGTVRSSQVERVEASDDW